MNENFLYFFKSTVQKNIQLVIIENNKSRGKKIPVWERTFNFNVTRKKELPDLISS